MCDLQHLWFKMAKKSLGKKTEKNAQKRRKMSKNGEKILKKRV